MDAFTDRLCEAVATADGGSAYQRSLIGRAIGDTVAVAAAGFAEPVTRASLQAYSGQGTPTWSGEPCESAEAAIMINAIAAHALDFDDVYLDSSTHPSAVIVPAVLRGGTDQDPDEIISAVAAGLIAARAVAARLGKGHYERGWHGTGTIGVFAAAAAAGRLAGLDLDRQRSAFGLAAAMSGGLQINFSTMAKPCHAGFAAAAGVRAVRLAAAGVTAARDVFGDGGYADLYGHGAAFELGDDAFALRPDQIAVKLYPCCFAASRLVGAALDAREKLGALFADETVAVQLQAPKGSLKVLRFADPKTGMEAKFSGQYTVCAALLDGPLSISNFADESVARADIRACMARLEITEDAGQPSHGDIEFGQVRLAVFKQGVFIDSFIRSAIPGAPSDPATQGQVCAKAQSCLALFKDQFGHDFPILEPLRLLPEAAAWVFSS